MRSVRFLLGFLQQRRHIGPELGACITFGGRQLQKRLRVADADKVVVLSPVSDVLLDRFTRSGRAAFEAPEPRLQISAEPVEGLLAEARSFLVVELPRVLALSCGCQGGKTGGVVAMAVP